MSSLDAGVQKAYQAAVRRIYAEIAADDLDRGTRLLWERPPSPRAAEWLPRVDQEVPPPAGGAPPTFLETQITFTRRDTGVEFPPADPAAAQAMRILGERIRAQLDDADLTWLRGAGRAAPSPAPPAPVPPLAPAPAPAPSLRIELQIGRWVPRWSRRRRRYSVQRLYRRFVWQILRPMGPAWQVLADLALEPGARYRIVPVDLLAPPYEFLAISPTHLLALGDWGRPWPYGDIVRMVETLHTRMGARP